MLAATDSTYKHKTLKRHINRHRHALLFFVVCSIAAIALPVLAVERVDAIALPAGYTSSKAVLMHPGGQYAYMVVAGSLLLPAKVLKIDLATMDVVGSNNFTSVSGAVPIGGVIDAMGAYAYIAFVTSNATPHLGKFDLATMQPTAAQATLSNYPMSIVIDPAGTYVYTGSDDGVVEKTNVVSMQTVGIVQTGQTYLRSAAIDPPGSNAYFATYTNPARVVKVDLATFQWAGVVTLDADQGEVGVFAAAIDPAGTTGYFATYTNPAHLVKVDLATFQRTGGIRLEANENFIRAISIDSTGQFAYLGTNIQPLRLIEIDLGSFQRSGSTIVGPDNNGISNLAVDASGEYAYAGTDGLIKIALRNQVPHSLTLVPPYIDFHNQQVGISSTTRTVSLHNIGTGAASSLQFGVLGSGFSADTSACTMPLPAGSACAIDITFTPSATGIVRPQWRVSSAQGATAHLGLHARGVPASRNLSISPGVLDFGTVDIGTPTPPTMFATLTNTGIQPVEWIQLDREDYLHYTINNSNCPSLAVGASCTISVTFKPMAAATSSRTIRVRSEDLSSETHLALTGSGTWHQYAALMETFDQSNHVDFGSVAIGQTRTSPVALRNFGTDELTQLTLTTTDPRFSIANLMCLHFAPGAYCEAEIAFAPTAAGPASAILHLSTAEGATAQIPLDGFGTGDANPSHLFFDTPMLDFGEVGIGTWSNARTVLLSNDGGGALITNILSVNPEFVADASACGSWLAPAGSCAIRIRFMPATTQQSMGQVMVITDQGVGTDMLLFGAGSTDAIFQGGYE